MNTSTNHVQKSRREVLVAAAIYATAGIRAAASRCGIPQFAEFINGLVIAGVLAERYLPGDAGPGFPEILAAEVAHRREIVEAAAFRDNARRLGDHVIGVVRGDREGQVMDLALAAAMTLHDAMVELAASKEEALQMAAIGLVASIAAVTDEGHVWRHLVAAVRGARDQRDTAAIIVPFVEAGLPRHAMPRVEA